MIRPSSAKSPNSLKEVDSSDSDIPFTVNVATEDADDTPLSQQVVHNPATVAVAEPYVNRWNQLVSQTNWEKGAIISQWRQALVEQNASPTEYSDEAWTRSVEGVTSQHVGRLRRVYDRFKDTHNSYRGLYWTHFLVAMDWPDAELWLEGATQSKWSVAEMRRTRWESTGQPPEQAPDSNPVMSVDADEDFSPLAEADDEVEEDREPADRIGTDGPWDEGPDFGEGERDEKVADEAEYEDVDDDDIPKGFDNPFADLPDLPSDIADAMEQFKLAIVRHRLAEWTEITPATIQRVLDALGSFARSGG